MAEETLENEFKFAEPPVERNIIFYSTTDEVTGEQEQVGELNWDDGPMKFIGDAEESAKIFFDHIIRMVCTCGCQVCEDEDDS